MKLEGRSRLLAWTAILAAVVALLLVAGLDGGGTENDSERVQRLSETYACPVCSGESVAESNAAVAATIRRFISDEVTSGATDGEIRNELIQAYGVEVLLNPPAEGISTLVWVLPVVMLVLGAVGVAAAVTRSGSGWREPTERDRELLHQAREAVE